MLVIRCPYCHELRHEEELVYGGEAGIARPAPTADDAAWTDYLFMRSNPKGTIREQWCCSTGCGQWFIVCRDTVSDQVFEVLAYGGTIPAPRPGT